MEVIRDNDKEANIILKEYEDTDLRVWSYSPTHNVIKIIVGMVKRECILFLIFSDCDYIRGELSLDKVRLKISEEDNGTTEIIDRNSDFQIKGGGFILKKGLVKEFFGDPPDDFNFPWNEYGN